VGEATNRRLFQHFVAIRLRLESPKVIATKRARRRQSARFLIPAAYALLASRSQKTGSNYSSYGFTLHGFFANRQWGRCGMVEIPGNVLNLSRSRRSGFWVPDHESSFFSIPGEMPP
jgi:hypothetical protein